jgi:carbonic anhydrase
LILDFGIGYIFSGRVAGNVADEDIVGSMEFACKVAGSKVVLVMGHAAGGERSSKNYAFVDAVARTNVSLTIAKVREMSPVLRDLESTGSIKIAGAMYNLETGVVEFLA